MQDLTASEITNLIASFTTNTMASVVTSDVLKKAESDDVRSMLELGVQIAKTEVEGAQYFMNQVGRVLPVPFTEQDILLPNEKYYSDNFIILLKYKLGQDALNLYVTSLSTSTNPEVRAFYKKLSQDTAELMEKCLELMVKRGLHQPVIHIPKSDEVERAQTKKILGRFIGEKRPLSAPEVLQIQNNFMATEVLKEILRSFSKTETPEIREHFERGKDMCSKHLEMMQAKFEKEELPQMPTWEAEVDTEGLPHFSDRLMLFKVSLMVGATGGRYGVTATATLRKDIGSTFSKMMGEVVLYAEDAAALMIKYNMFDEPPLVKLNNNI
ncbi:DUF3231 family protein [Alkalibacillus haloalkaliphilus]|uniref:DUF3231 family protein n=1 Tax=Alkalibacillus haloalkaliphilus TaxID=94136 RepID=UPI0029366CD8|nr:DUF3231 family protein [Alkalibacillus haloalkaliphilus]MDV2581974.1 DUF3231 family protein [Alkalibacillus haloalkaliphilus]